MKLLHLALTATLIASPVLMTSCSSLMKLTGVNIDSIPGTKDLTLDQNQLIGKHSSATIKLLESQKLAFEAIGNQKEAAEIESKINHLKSNPNDSSALTSSMEFCVGQQKVINQKISAFNTKDGLRTDLWQASCKKLNEGLIEEAKLAASNTQLAIKLSKMMKSADAQQKILLGTQFRPIVYFVTTLPKDYQLMVQAQSQQEQASKKLDIALPKLFPVKASLPSKSFDF